MPARSDVLFHVTKTLLSSDAQAIDQEFAVHLLVGLA
jgi:hypothetical protein